MKENDWKRENLKGSVKSVKAITYDALEKFGKIEKGKINSFSPPYKRNILQ